MMRIQKTFSVLLVFVALAFVSTQGMAKQVSHNSHSIDIVSWQTSNGAKVLYVYAPQLPMVDVRVVFDAGSARDGDKPGLASLTNSMLDLGAGKWDTNELAEQFDNVGANFSNSVARDMAIVQLRSLTDKDILDVALSGFRAIINEPVFNPDELERIRRQTLIALKSQLQSPGTIASKAFYKALYDKQPYASPSIGTLESVKKISRDDLLAFYKKYYVASNAIIAIVGDLDKAAASALAENIIDSLPKGEKAASLPPVKKLSRTEVINKPHPSTQTHILVGQAGMKRGDPDYFPLYVGNHILGGSGFGSRIMEEIREKRGLAYSSYSYFSPMRVEGPFIMGLQTKNDKRDEALALLDKTLRDFIAEGPTKKELNHALKNITGGFPLRIDSNKDIVSYIAMIGFYDLPLDYLNNFNANVEAVTVEKIRDAFSRRIDPDKLLTVQVGADLASE